MDVDVLGAVGKMEGGKRIVVDPLLDVFRIENPSMTIKRRQRNEKQI